jgi:hypothetical protein
MPTKQFPECLRLAERAPFTRERPSTPALPNKIGRPEGRPKLS